MTESIPSVLSAAPSPIVDSGEGQMSLLEETAEVLRFLEIVGKNRILSESAMHCRISACSKLFSVLREGENSVEYLLKNLSLIASRYEKKTKNVTRSTLRVYKSRVKSSLEDYQSWCRDPIGWEQTVLNRQPLQKQKQKKARAKAKAREEQLQREPDDRMAEAPLMARTGSRRLMFPVRDGFDVEVVIPAEGLTAKELLKFQLFLYSFCQEAEGAKANTWLPVSNATH